MKKEIHPEYFEATVTCIGCNAVFVTGSTAKEIRISVCSNCHPFYTGTQKLMDTEGRVDRYKKKYAKFLDTEATAKSDAGKAAAAK